MVKPKYKIGDYLILKAGFWDDLLSKKDDHIVKITAVDEDYFYYGPEGSKSKKKQACYCFEPIEDKNYNAKTVIEVLDNSKYVILLDTKTIETLYGREKLQK